LRFFIGTGVTIADASVGCFRLRPRLRQVFGSTSGMAMRPRIIATGKMEAAHPPSKPVCQSAPIRRFAFRVIAERPHPLEFLAARLFDNTIRAVVGQFRLTFGYFRTGRSEPGQFQA
jgi:hypothetical protein